MSAAAAQVLPELPLALACRPGADGRPKCFKCGEPCPEADTRRIRTMGDQIRTLHAACWESEKQRMAAEDEERRRRSIEQRVKYVEDRFESTMERCTLPLWPFARFDNAEFRRRSSKKIVSAVERWDPLAVRTLMLTAPTGRGKTAVISAWLWRHRDQQVEKARAGDEKAMTWSFVFATGPELATARRNTQLGHEAPLIERSLETSILFIDELGFEKQSEVPFEIIDHRYREQAITVVTTGLKPKEFRARYGDALFRRLAESGAVIEDWPRVEEGPA
ncbi:MAG TPA: hypothetical protein VJN18_14855 [Polyangiaceae bacterium]|nr:hypothetical protein [Polyangiaceae bacterium]